MNTEPLWAPGAADYLASLLTGDEVGFEWGGGASSIWLAPQIKRLMVMETDPTWADVVMNGTGDNCGVWVRDFNDPDYIYRGRECLPRPNLWLIDGYRRIDCLAAVEMRAQEGDIVVLDDAIDYAEHKLGAHVIDRFAQPHPHAGIPINHKKYGHLRNTVRQVHADTKETWIWQV